MQLFGQLDALDQNVDNWYCHVNAYYFINLDNKNNRSAAR